MGEVDFDEDASASMAGSTTASAPASLPDRYNAVMRGPPTQILPFLFLGSAANAANKKQLVELGITHILNMKECNFGTDPPGFKFLHVAMSDFGDQNLQAMLPRCLEFIEKARRKSRKVLIHCRGGVNRSATVVLAYLMAREGYTLKDAWEWVRKGRPQVCPHEGYMEQLRNYELKLFGTISLTAEQTGPSAQQRLRVLKDQFRQQHASSRSLSAGDAHESGVAPTTLSALQSATVGPTTGRVFPRLMTKSTSRSLGAAKLPLRPSSANSGAAGDGGDSTTLDADTSAEVAGPRSSSSSSSGFNDSSDSSPHTSSEVSKRSGHSSAEPLSPDPAHVEPDYSALAVSPDAGAASSKSSSKGSTRKSGTSDRKKLAKADKEKSRDKKERDKDTDANLPEDGSSVGTAEPSSSTDPPAEAKKTKKKKGRTDLLKSR